MKLELVEWAKDYDASRLITNPNAIDVKKKTFTEDGIFSERIFGRGDASETIYECSCGKQQGTFLSQEICPICGSKVQNKGASIEINGWIDLGDYYIIKPFYYYQFQKIITQKHLELICSYDPKLTIEGNVEETHNYHYIGLDYFHEHFDEILDDLFANTKKKSSAEEAYNLIKTAHKEGKVWINKHPVYSTVMRPAILIDKNFQYAEENTFFNQIIKNIKILQEKSEIERTKLNDQSLLWEIQRNANLIYNKVIMMLNGKTGVIRLRLLGNRINFSARNVICPTPCGAKINEVYYPYLASLELFKYEIINILSKKYRSYKEAIKKWNEATFEFSKEVYEVLEEIRTKTNLGLQLILNRNPTIELGSMLMTEIKQIKTDYYDLTLNISNLILSFLAGDYDGDVLTTASLKDESFKEWFTPFDPRNLLISNDTGLFNRKFTFAQDYAYGAELLLA
jgi:DNA-directed RNA polymerase beta' subunit